jgi:hypothetical protein
VELAEQKANYLGLHSFRTRNFAKEGTISYTLHVGGADNAEQKWPSLALQPAVHYTYSLLAQ